MPFIVWAQQLAFQPVDPANPTVPVGDEEIVLRGQPVPDYAPAFTVSALVNAGLVRYLEDPDPAVLPASALEPQVRTSDMPAVLPSDPNGVPPLIGDPTPVVEEEPDEPAELPSASDKKEVWEAYAQRPEIGMTQAEAESMTKANLMAEVNTRYEAAHQ